MADTDDTSDTKRGGNIKTPRIRKRKWALTWNSFPENFHELLTQNTKNFRGQIEAAPTTGSLHLQCAIEFQNAVGPGHVQSCFPGSSHEPAKNWAALLEYVHKEDTRAGEQFGNIRLPRKPNDPLEGRKLHAWQETLITLVDTPATEAQARTVNWYWSREGNVGKTSIARHLCLKYPGEVIYTNGKAADVKFALATKYASKSVDVRCVIYGIPRGGMGRCDYTCLEELGDQIFFSPKYESGMVQFAPLHIVVFANTPPHLASLSEDRWNVVQVGQESPQPLPTEGAAAPR